MCVHKIGVCAYIHVWAFIALIASCVLNLGEDQIQTMDVPIDRHMCEIADITREPSDILYSM